MADTGQQRLGGDAESENDPQTRARPERGVRVSGTFESTRTSNGPTEDTEDTAPRGDASDNKSGDDADNGLDGFGELTPIDTIEPLVEARPASSEAQPEEDDDEDDGEDAGAQVVDDSELEVVDDAERGGEQPAEAIDADDAGPGTAAINDAPDDDAPDAAEGRAAGDEDAELANARDALENDQLEADEPTLVRPMPVPWLEEKPAAAQSQQGWRGNPSPFPAQQQASSRPPASSDRRNDPTWRRISLPSEPTPRRAKAALAKLAALAARADQRMLVALALLGAAAAGAVVLSWPSSEPAVIQLSTSPADANVLLNGVTLSTASPHILSSIEPDAQHVLAVQKRGYRGWHTVLRLAPGQVLTMPEVKLFPADEAAPPASDPTQAADAPEEPQRGASPPSE